MIPTQELAIRGKCVTTTLCQDSAKAEVEAVEADEANHHLIMLIPTADHLAAGLDLDRVAKKNSAK